MCHYVGFWQIGSHIICRRICLVHNGVLGSVAKLQHLGSMWLLCLGAMAGYSVLCSLVEYH